MSLCLIKGVFYSSGLDRSDPKKIEFRCFPCFYGFYSKDGLGDNMKTIMDDSRTQYKKGIVNNKFYQFSQDMGFKARTCIAKRTQTKSKVETQMKILHEIDAYQG